MQSFKNALGLCVVQDMARAIAENKEYLSALDGAIGDGDHGINMNKGFASCAACLEASDSMSTGLEKLSAVLLGEIGGSMGPLYGMFFAAMQRLSAHKEHIDARVFGDMLKAAYDEIVELGGAKVGDKTLIDTLEPALAAYKEHLKEEASFSQALDAMDAAAEQGKESTKDLVAKIGRASRLGDRTRGALDAGAASCYVLLHSMAGSIKNLLEEESA